MESRVDAGETTIHESGRGKEGIQEGIQEENGVCRCGLAIARTLS